MKYRVGDKFKFISEPRMGVMELHWKTDIFIIVYKDNKHNDIEFKNTSSSSGRCRWRYTITALERECKLESNIFRDVVEHFNL